MPKISSTCFYLNNITCHQVTLAYFSVISVNYTLIGLRICWLYSLQRDKTIPKRRVLDMALNFIWWWGSHSRDLGCGITLSLLLLSGMLWPSIVVPARVPSMSQIDLFKNGESCRSHSSILSLGSKYGQSRRLATRHPVRQ